MAESLLKANIRDVGQPDCVPRLQISRAPTERYEEAILSPLPPGYSAQPAWGYCDHSGRYTFNRVYEAPEAVGGPGSLMVGQLDEGRSYWIMTQPGASRRVSYSQARRFLGARLTFEEFSSPLGMRDELRELLRAGQNGGAIVTS